MKYDNLIIFAFESSKGTAERLLRGKNNVYSQVQQLIKVQSHLTKI